MCSSCEAKKTAEYTHRLANGGNRTSPSLMKKIGGWGEKLLGEQRGNFVPHVAPVQHLASAAPAVIKYRAEVPNYTRRNTHGLRPRPQSGPPNPATRKRRASKRYHSVNSHPKNDKATDLLVRDNLPSVIQEEDETTPKTGPEKSWATGDGLRLQKEATQVATPVIIVIPPAPVSNFDTLPSQIDPLRQNPPERIVQRQRLPRPSTAIRGQTGRKPLPQQKIERKPLPPLPTNRYATELTTNGIYPISKGCIRTQPLPASASSDWSDYQKETYGKQTSHTAYSAAKIDGKSKSAHLSELDGKAVNPNIGRHSRTEEQASEFFFDDYTAGQYDPKTLAALHGRTPTVLRAGVRKRLSPLDYEQAAELFFFSKTQSDPTTFVTVHAGGQSTTHHSSIKVPVAAVQTPTVPCTSNKARARAPPVPQRLDLTYKTSTVGQIPTHYKAYDPSTTTSSPSSSSASTGNFKPSSTLRPTKLSSSELKSWESFISTHPTTPSMLDSPPLPKLQLPAFSSLNWEAELLHQARSARGDEVRVSSRISRPGAHDFYSGDRNVRAAGQPKRQATSAMNAWEAPACAWDEIVLKTCESIESISTTRSYARKAV